MTNREWLQSLSDEELAKILRRCCMCVYCNNECMTNKPHDCDTGNVLWLQSEFTGLLTPTYWFTNDEDEEDEED